MAVFPKKKKSENYTNFNVIDNSLSTHSRCCPISYFMACIVGGYVRAHSAHYVIGVEDSSQRMRFQGF